MRRRTQGASSLVLRVALLVNAWVVALATGCGRESMPPGELLRLRWSARLEATRDTPEGFAAAAGLYARIAAVTGEPADLLNLARGLVLAGTAREADAALTRLGAPARGLPSVGEAALYLEALAAKRLGDLRRVESRLLALLERRPDQPEALYQLAGALLQDGRPSDALPVLDRLLARSPGHLGALYRRAHCLRAVGQSEAAEAALAEFSARKGQAEGGGGDDSLYERCAYTQTTLELPAGQTQEPPQEPLAFEAFGATPAAAVPGAVSLALTDLDGDARPEVLVASTAGNRYLRLHDGALEDATELCEAAAGWSSSLALPADFDNDSLIDLYLASKGEGRLLRGLGQGAFEALPREVAELPSSAAGRWVDYDHDGDLDLVLLEAQEVGGCRPAAFRNNGNLTFLREAQALAGGVTDGALSIAVADLDRGNDIDLVVPNGTGPAAMFLNQRTGPFRREALEGLRGCRLLAAADLDGDGSPDLIGAPTESEPLRVAWCRGGGERGAAPAFDVRDVLPLTDAPEDPARALLVLDLDDDGDADVLLGGAAGVRLLRNAGGRLRLEQTHGIEARGVLDLVVLDADGDGALDLMTLEAGGELRLWRRRSPAPARSLRLELIGTRDNRGGVGAHVEVLSGGVYQRLQVGTSEKLLGTGGLRIGLGKEAPGDVAGLEVLWPNGVAQPLFPRELASPDGRITVTQKRGLEASCPFLYTFDGARYRFQTDVLGIAPLDEWLPPGEVPHLDPEEFVRIEAGRLAVRDGRLRLVITEELRETAYVDRVSLIRVWHPEGTLVVTDESTRQGAVAPLALSLVEEGALMPPTSVRDERGRAAGVSIGCLDRHYFHGYPQGPPQLSGWSPEHSVTVAPPPIERSEGALLLLTGRIFWPDSTVAYSLSQAGCCVCPPRLELWARAPDGPGAGEPARVAPMGFPTGMDRTIVMALPTSDEMPMGSLVIRAHHWLLWDRLLFAPRSASLSIEEAALDSGGTRRCKIGEVPVQIGWERLRLATASLGFHGFSRSDGDRERHEHTRRFEEAEAIAPFIGPSGWATRRGGVLELVAAADDRLVVLVPGDGVELAFDAGAQAPPGRVTYFLQVTGWAKEAGFHNRTGARIEPLPYREMSSYPPPRGIRGCSQDAPDQAMLRTRGVGLGRLLPGQGPQPTERHGLQGGSRP